MNRMRKLFQALVYIVFGLTILNWLDQGMRWFLKTYDPVFARTLVGKGGQDISETQESVFAVLKNKNGQVKTVR